MNETGEWFGHIYEPTIGLRLIDHLVANPADVLDHTVCGQAFEEAWFEVDEVDEEHVTLCLECRR